MSYRPANFEKKWQQYWEDNKVYEVSNQSDRPKYYILDMFPYPSGAGLHVGHPLGYIASDIFSRYKRLKGFNVLHPMGYDAFGLPAEQYALETGVHPAISTDRNIKTFKSQLKNIGFSYDWSREIKTSDPKFYKWTQWIFLQMYKHYYDIGQDKALAISVLVAHFEKQGSAGIQACHTLEQGFTSKEWQKKSDKEKDDILMNFRLMYRKESYVNWCEALGTVLANDEIKDGSSERGGFPVTKKSMMQWSMRTTAYAQRLLDGLDQVEWPNSLRAMQQNWIGRSEGALIRFKVLEHDLSFDIFTTRPDTIFGATLMVLAPDHELVNQITSSSQKETVTEYQKYVAQRSERDRISETKKVTGAFTGAYVQHPFNEEQVPIWISEYVLKDYGTGAIMAVPSDDLKDNAFAKKFGIPIIEVVDRSEFPKAEMQDKLGTMINSEFLDGLSVKDAINTILRKIEEQKLGTKEINYRLRDANYSRQRYWGEPFPIYYDHNGVSIAEDEDKLPLRLPPMDDFKPSQDGRSPLARMLAWSDLAKGQVRETDTMPGFAGSSWYYLRYMDPDNDNEMVNPEVLDYWQDVDLYIGGAEHAVGHLLYSRTWHKFLYDLGKVPTREPFKRLINQGMIQGVIEFIYLQKEKKNDHYHFLCAGLVEMNEDENDFIRIPVHIDFIADYGTASSYLGKSGLDQFVKWRPEYSDAIFECSKGVYHQGIFNSIHGETESQLNTKSEVGKMSKRYFNVINPDDVVNRYGADAFRMYEMFLGPIEQSKPWDINKIDGVSKFLRKVWSLFFNDEELFELSNDSADKAALKILHQTIQAVENDINKFSFNTCVSHFMICVNELKKQNCNQAEILIPLLVLLAPFAPHLTEELWHLAGKEASIHQADYPTFEAKYVAESQVSYPVCINGKKRAMLDVDKTLSKDDIEKQALALDAIQKWIDGKTVRKVIVVPNKMINVVV